MITDTHTHIYKIYIISLHEVKKSHLCHFVLNYGCLHYIIKNYIHTIFNCNGYSYNHNHHIVVTQLQRMSL